MLNKILSLSISFIILSTAGVTAFAQGPGSLNDNSAANTAGTTGNLYDIKQLIDNSRENIKEVNQKIKDEAILKRDQMLAEQAREYYEKGMQLTNEGKLEEARDYFKKAIRITESSGMAKYIQENQRQIKKQQEVEAAYNEGVDLYNQKNEQPARVAFEHVEELAPDYRATGSYLKIIDQDIATEKALDAKRKALELQRQQAQLQRQQQEAEAARKKQEVETEYQQKEAEAVHQRQELEIENQQKEAQAARDREKQIEIARQQERERERQASLAQQAQEIAALAERSAQLTHQISDVADDTSTAKTEIKMAQVDEILRNLKENKERLLHEKEVEEWKKQQAILKANEEKHWSAVERMYQDGIGYLNSNEYAKAKINFLELEDSTPNYKDTRHYLSIIQEDLEKAHLDAIKKRELAEAEHLKEIQEKENVEALRRIQLEQEKQQMIEQEQQASLKELAQKASDINDEIIRLSGQQEYEEMKNKFTELEDTVSALTKLKVEMAKQKGDQERVNQLAEATQAYHNEVIKDQEQEDKEIRENYKEQSLSEYRPELIKHPSLVDHFKYREVVREQNELFSEAVDRYEHRQFTQAKLLFGELAAQHDQRAAVWLRKVDHAITKELLNSQEGEEMERTAFLADQLSAQRELSIIHERERQRQKKLTEELERQKNLYDDDRLLELRKEETMKAEERERQRQEEKRLKLENESEKQQEMLRFHKIETTAKPQPQAKPQVQVVPQAPPAAVPAIPPPSPQELREQARQKRKELRAQRAAEHQARIKAAIEAREKIKEERQRERERQQELREAEAKAEAEKSAQDQKRREEALHQQEEQREEITKQEEIVRDETQRKEEFERQEREQQAQVEAQREAVRKQLEDGVESMYQDAMSLYNQGEYSAAADRFKDVQDILPGYKRSEQYMDEARQRSLRVKPQVVNIPVASANSTYVPTAPVAAVASPPESRQDNVSKALDLFEPDAK